MADSVVSALVPPTAVRRGGAPARPMGSPAVRRVPILPLPQLRTRSSVYGSASVDDRGRVMDRRLFDALGWPPGQPVSIDRQRTAVMVTAHLRARRCVRGPRQRRALRQWRAGAFEQPSPPWRLGVLLDHIARTGRPPTYTAPTGQERIRYADTVVLGGNRAESTWASLFLTPPEASPTSVSNWPRPVNLLRC